MERFNREHVEHQNRSFKKTSIYLYTSVNCSFLWRYLSQSNPFRSILALDLNMCENVSCVPLHTSRYMVPMTTTNSNCHSLMIRGNKHDMKALNSV